MLSDRAFICLEPGAAQTEALRKCYIKYIQSVGCCLMSFCLSFIDHTFRGPESHPAHVPGRFEAAATPLFCALGLQEGTRAQRHRARRHGGTRERGYRGGEVSGGGDGGRDDGGRAGACARRCWRGGTRWAAWVRRGAPRSSPASTACTGEGSRARTATAAATHTCARASTTAPRCRRGSSAVWGH
jgi:hypothetical protein